MEEELETGELKEKMDEHVEHHEHAAEHEGKSTPAWIRYLSLSTAMVAVFAAVASLMSGSNSNEAILEKSNAMLSEARAADAWAEYQAIRIKSAMAENQVEILGAAQPDAAARLTAKAKDYEAKSATVMVEAKADEQQVADANDASELLMHKHHKFAITVTLLQISIALAAIAALTRKKPLWFAGLAVSGVGIVTFVMGLLA